MEINEADVAELVDARDLKSLDGNVVRVRVPPPAPLRKIGFDFAALLALACPPGSKVGQIDVHDPLTPPPQIGSGHLSPTKVEKGIARVVHCKNDSVECPISSMRSSDSEHRVAPVF
jgi:hypothetical protein